MKSIREIIEESAHWQIRRFESEEAWKVEEPMGLSEFDGNALLNEGINEIWTILCSAASGTKWDKANAALGVGNSNAAIDPTHTGLDGASQNYVSIDSVTFGSSQKATWISTFQGSDGNFDWQEFTIANGAGDSYVNMNRKVSNQGTKVSGQVWELTLEITLQ